MKSSQLGTENEDEEGIHASAECPNAQHSLMFFHNLRHRLYHLPHPHENPMTPMTCPFSKIIEVFTFFIFISPDINFDTSCKQLNNSQERVEGFWRILARCASNCEKANKVVDHTPVGGGEQRPGGLCGLVVSNGPASAYIARRIWQYNVSYSERVGRIWEPILYFYPFWRNIRKTSKPFDPFTVHRPHNLFEGLPPLSCEESLVVQG